MQVVQLKARIFLNGDEISLADAAYLIRDLRQALRDAQEFLRFLAHAEDKCEECLADSALPQDLSDPNGS